MQAYSESTSTPRNYVFREGAPDFPCRAFLPSELERMNEELLGKKKPLIGIPPVAVLISGLPGCGKSSSVGRFFTEEIKMLDDKSTISCEDFVDIDFDTIRHYHGEYVNILNPSMKIDEFAGEVASARSIVSYRELVPWLIQGTNFEQTLFKDTDALVNTVLNRRLSFTMESILDNYGSFRFVQYLKQRGYNVFLLHVHCPLSEAIRRAEDRAYRTGRWSSADYITSREAGLIEWFPSISSYLVNECGGQCGVAVFDNSARDKPAVTIYNSARIPQAVVADLSADLDSLYKLTALTQNAIELDFYHMSHAQRALSIEAFAESCIALVFPDAVNQLQGTSFSLAGGCFKSLITGNAPNDLDLWPHDAASRERLLKVLQESELVKLKNTTRFNYQFSVTLPPPSASSVAAQNNQRLCFRGIVPVPELVRLPPSPNSREEKEEEKGKQAKLELQQEQLQKQDEKQEELAVEVTVYSKSNLADILEGFDLALSAIGVSFTDGKITESLIYPEFFMSLSTKKPLLLGATATVTKTPTTITTLRSKHLRYLLTTAERVVRYASELGFPWPVEQMEYLRGVFAEKSTEDQLDAIERWKATTRGDAASNTVREWFAGYFPEADDDDVCRK